jgi:hypothetical protein
LYLGKAPVVIGCAQVIGAKIVNDVLRSGDNQISSEIVDTWEEALPSNPERREPRLASGGLKVEVYSKDHCIKMKKKNILFS